MEEWPIVTSLAIDRLEAELPQLLTSLKAGLLRGPERPNSDSRRANLQEQASRLNASSVRPTRSEVQMWAVAVTATLATALYLIVLFRVNAASTLLPFAWRLLSWSGIPLSLAGLAFTVRFWRPSPGPFVANRAYPFGSHLNAWAVSFGFTWLAFGLLFSGATAYVARNKSWAGWALLAATWVLCWLPHVVIGIGFALAGDNRKSAAFYETWARDPAGAIILISASVTLLWHFVFAICGFVGTARDISAAQRQARPNSG